MSILHLTIVAINGFLYFFKKLIIIDCQAYVDGLLIEHAHTVSCARKNIDFKFRYTLCQHVGDNLRQQWCVVRPNNGGLRAYPTVV